MVECSQCRQWYHTDCMNVPKIALDETDVDWFCYNCSHLVNFPCVHFLSRRLMRYVAVWLPTKLH